MIEGEGSGLLEDMLVLVEDACCAGMAGDEVRMTLLVVEEAGLYDEDAVAVP